nr:MAG TPA: hypothetical protein [Caudoviricetes sp.]
MLTSQSCYILYIASHNRRNPGSSVCGNDACNGAISTR